MFQKVLEFTKATFDEPIPKVPRRLNKGEIELVVKLVLEELFELCEASMNSTSDSVYLLYGTIETLKDVAPLKDHEDEVEVVAAQQDAIVDLIYVAMNAAAKTGIDLDKVFNLVHEANMKKVDPETGKVQRRGDGKILKPEGWTPPDIEREVKKQRGEEDQ